MCNRVRTLLAVIDTIISNPIPPRPSPKAFNPKCPELPKLKSYHFGAPDSYWEEFPSYRNMHGGNHIIFYYKRCKNIKIYITGSPYRLDPDLMLKMAEDVGVTDMNTVREVYRDIKEGCNMKVSN